MENAPLGQLANAPLAYVIAQVRFTPVVQIQTFIPALQERIRRRFPLFNVIAKYAVQIGPQMQMPTNFVAPQQWHFGNAANRTALVINQSSVFLHATEYTRWTDFELGLRDVLEAVQAVLEGILVTGFGCRYVDLILPEQGETPEQYFQPSLTSCPKLSRVPQDCAFSGVTALEYPLAEGALLVKYARGDGQPVVPQDTAVDHLAPSSIMQRAQANRGPAGILDTDRVVNLASPQPFDAEAACSRLRGMHGDLSAAFKELMSDHARAVWSTRRAS